MTSSQKVWGDEPPPEEMGQKVVDSMRVNFPDCKNVMEQSLKCAKEHHACDNDPCRDVNNRLQFCLLHSYCPEPAEKFAKCVQGYNKPVDVTRFPRGCQRAFNHLDACMIANTIEKEA